MLDIADIVVGTKYIHGDVILEVSRIEGEKIWFTDGECLRIDTALKQLTLLHKEQEDINLETHTGKVNDDRLYEFSDDEDFEDSVKGELLYVRDANRSQARFLCMEDEFYTLCCKYCRLYKEPVEKVYIGSFDVFQFCKDSKKVVYVRKPKSQQWKPYFLDIELDNNYEWTTINDETKEYSKPKEFLKKYLTEV